MPHVTFVKQKVFYIFAMYETVCEKNSNALLCLFPVLPELTAGIHQKQAIRDGAEAGLSAGNHSCVCAAHTLSLTLCYTTAFKNICPISRAWYKC